MSVQIHQSFIRRALSLASHPRRRTVMVRRLLRLLPNPSRIFLVLSDPPFHQSTTLPPLLGLARTRRPGERMGCTDAVRLAGPHTTVVMIMCTTRIETTPSLPPPYTASTQPRLPPLMFYFFPPPLPPEFDALLLIEELRWRQHSGLNSTGFFNSRRYRPALHFQAIYRTCLYPAPS